MFEKSYFLMSISHWFTMSVIIDGTPLKVTPLIVSTYVDKIFCSISPRFTVIVDLSGSS